MTDLRKFSKQTQSRLVAGFVLILLIVGGGLIYMFYGAGGAISGIMCIVAGLAPLLLIWGAMKLIEWIANKANDYE